jgi:hypothetical protein
MNPTLPKYFAVADEVLVGLEEIRIPACAGEPESQGLWRQRQRDFAGKAQPAST